MVRVSVWRLQVRIGAERKEEAAAARCFCNGCRRFCLRCRCVNLVRSRYSRWRIAGHGGSVAGAVHVFRSVEHESSALAGEDAETLQWSTTGVNAARNWRRKGCDGAVAGMKLRDVAVFVCLLQRVSGTEDGGGSCKVQGCLRDPWRLP
ncbi:hypothetical protein DEO72_LG3g1700 [Vigna unguiculata]|uniref:Uncharacterized protein n=1 Tax=Vigna unguiculata TaxID=3917 RepID=A0A4D6LFI0_VIGUN|nr:hypothetical protein DEO72_LG3g1700 [Vigna unguiculata]